MPKATVQYQELNRELRKEWLALEDSTEDPRMLRIRRDRIANQVVEVNDKLLWASVQSYIRMRPEIADDLHAAAATELWRAFLQWDPEAATLSTYSRAYITGAVRREVAKHDYPHLTYDEFTLRGNLLKMQKKMKDQLGREPTTGELAKKLKVSEQLVERAFAPRATSLDQPVGSSDDRTTLGAMLEDESDLPADDAPNLDALLDADVASELDPVDVLTHLMVTGAGVSYPASSVEVAAQLNVGQSGVPKTATQVSLEIAYDKILSTVRGEPTAQQLATAAGCSLRIAEEFVQARA